MLFQSNRPTITLFLILLFAIHANCGPNFKPDTIGPNGKPNWTNQSVSLEIKGFGLKDGIVIPQSTTATGCWIGPGLLITNAHAIIRALEITAITDDGERLAVESLVAMDLHFDLALLQTRDRETGTPVQFANPDLDLRELRGSPVLSVAFLNGDLTIAKGTLSTVRMADSTGLPELLHASELGNGASGGPVYSADFGTVLGINSGAYTNPTRVAAVPVGTVAQFIRQFDRSSGVPLTAVFEDTDALKSAAVSVAQADRCLDPGDSIDLPFPIDGMADFAFGVVVVTGAPPLHIDLHTVSGQTLWEHSAVRTFGRVAFGSMELLRPADVHHELHFRAALPSSAADGACLVLTVTRLDWARAHKEAVATRANNRSGGAPNRAGGSRSR